MSICSRSLSGSVRVRGAESWFPSLFPTCQRAFCLWEAFHFPVCVRVCVCYFCLCYSGLLRSDSFSELQFLTGIALMPKLSVFGQQEARQIGHRQALAADRAGSSASVCTRVCAAHACVSVWGAPAARSWAQASSCSSRRAPGPRALAGCLRVWGTQASALDRTCVSDVPASPPARRGKRLECWVRSSRMGPGPGTGGRVPGSGGRVPGSGRHPRVSSLPVPSPTRHLRDQGRSHRC